MKQPLEVHSIKTRRSVWHRLRRYAFDNELTMDKALEKLLNVVTGAEK